MEFPWRVFDSLRDGKGNHRAQFYQDITIPFYGYNRQGANISQGIRDNWWRQGMMGGIKAQYDCIKAPSAKPSSMRRRDAESLTGFPHGMPTTHAAQINADLLEFIRNDSKTTESLASSLRAADSPQAVHSF
jgi:non-heme chloroperoxidase